MNLIKAFEKKIKNILEETANEGKYYSGINISLDLDKIDFTDEKIIIDSTTFLEILKENEDLFLKNIQENIFLEFNMEENLDKINKKTLIITSSKKIELTNKNKKFLLSLKFSKIFKNVKINFVWDVEKSKHNKNVFFNFSNLPMIENFDFKTNYFDCITPFLQRNFDLYFVWKKKYDKNIENFKSHFVPFVLPNSKKTFNFYFIIEPNEIKNICNSQIYEFYIYLKNQLQEYDSNFYFQKRGNLNKNYKNCPDKIIKIQNMFNLDFDTFDKLPFSDPTFFNKIIITKSNNVNFKLKQGISCNKIIFENISGDFNFELFINDIDKKINMPKEVIIKDSQLSKLYLDNNFFNSFFNLSLKNKKLYFEKIIFENLKIDELFINDCLLPYINNIFQKENDFIIQSSQIDIQFKNITVNKLIIVSDFSTNGNIIMLDNKKEIKFFKISQNSTIHNFNNKNEYFFNYLLSTTNKKILSLILYNFAKEVINFKNFTFGIITDERKILEINKKDKNFLEIIFNDKILIKKLINFNNLKDIIN